MYFAVNREWLRVDENIFVAGNKNDRLRIEIELNGRQRAVYTNVKIKKESSSRLGSRPWLFFERDSRRWAAYGVTRTRNKFRRSFDASRGQLDARIFTKSRTVGRLGHVGTPIPKFSRKVKKLRRNGHDFGPLVGIASRIRPPLDL